ncbi:hypothetical protein Tco_1192110 [Tanacetum coccineum]
MAARGGRNNLLNALIAELEASGDYEEVFDLVMELRDDKHDEQDKVADFNRWIVVVEEKIHGKEIDLEMLEAEGNDAFALVCEAPMCLIRIAVGNAVSGFWQVYSEVLLHRLSFGRINWFSDYMDEYNHDPLVNYDNDNENDDLGYQSEEYFDEVQEDDENNHSNGNVVKRGITRLYKFRRVYGKPDGIKLSVTFDALNRISRKHRALFWGFLRDMVHKHIGLKILSWKKVDSEARDKLWDEITSESCFWFQDYLSAYNGTRWIRTCERENDQKKEIEPDEEPVRSTLWLKGWVNKDGEYPDDEIRSVGDKLKEIEDKIKEGTLKVDHGIDAMTVVLGKEKGGYARGVGSGVTYKRYFDLPRSRQASDERILLLSEVNWI